MYLVSLFGDFHRRNVPFHPVATWLRDGSDIRASDRACRRGEAGAGLAGLTPPAR